MSMADEFAKEQAERQAREAQEREDREREQQREDHIRREMEASQKQVQDRLMTPEPGEAEKPREVVEDQQRAALQEHLQKQNPEMDSRQVEETSRQLMEQQRQERKQEERELDR